jgi:hypothetical protein
MPGSAELEQQLGCFPGDIRRFLRCSEEANAEAQLRCESCKSRRERRRRVVKSRKVVTLFSRI